VSRRREMLGALHDHKMMIGIADAKR
jgi:hypothetical protein